MQFVRSLVVGLTRVVLVAVAAAILLGGSTQSAHAASKRKPSVLILYGQSSVNWPADVRTKLLSSGEFSEVATFDANAAVPTLGDMLPYDAVMLVTDLGFLDAAQLGNNLADYVDAGGGVVNTAFSTGHVTPPAGRWIPDYLSMVTGNISIATQQTLDLASITNQNHALLTGVASFNGGSSSFRSNQNNVAPGATAVARWTGGNILISAGPLPGRVDLNFYPVSNTIRADLWQTSTDGLKLMVNALLYVTRPRVLVVGSPSIPTWNDDVKVKIRSTGLIGITDTFYAGSAAPTLEQLQKYDAVLLYTDVTPPNAVALGNVFADYVDAGGGVVKAALATIYNNLQGRWLNNYDLITATNTPLSGTAITLGTLDYPSHPALNGVASFNGGAASYRSGGTLKPNAFTIAKWSDGNPLIVASTRFSNRIDLNFYPPSSSVNPDFWTGDGTKLLANSLVYTCKPYIACVASDNAFAADPVAKLLATRRFSGVQFLTASFVTPSPTDLKPFNAIYTWSWEQYSSTVGIGNNLADFVDAGGGVVVGMFANVNVSRPLGRWASGGYEIIPSPPAAYMAQPQCFLGTVLEPANPVNTFVRKFSGGLSYRFTTIPPLRGRAILQWSDGTTLAAVHNYLKRVDLGFYAASSGSGFSFGGGWNQRTDGTWLMANALDYVTYHKPCPGDFNADGFVNDLDFVIFAGVYDELLTARGDLNGDGVTSDPDFVLFAAAYDTFLCP